MNGSFKKSEEPMDQRSRKANIDIKKPESQVSMERIELEGIPIKKKIKTVSEPVYMTYPLPPILRNSFLYVPILPNQSEREYIISVFNEGMLLVVITLNDLSKTTKELNELNDKIRELEDRRKDLLGRIIDVLYDMKDWIRKGKEYLGKEDRQKMQNMVRNFELKFSLITPINEEERPLLREIQYKLNTLLITLEGDKK